FLFLRVGICCSFLFFFSSRRRHTRSDRDWSSDVCSSDLVPKRFSNPGPFAQDWRNALVRGELAGAMGRAVELFGLGTEVRGTRSLDRLELPPAICPLEAGGQQ